MAYPDGFKELVSLEKKVPVKTLKGKDIWEKFCQAQLIGKDRSEPEIAFLMNLLRNYLDYDYVKKSGEFKWHEEVESFLRERLGKIRDDETMQIISGVLRDLTYIASGIKEGLNYFEKKNILDKIDEITRTREKTESLIKEIAEDKAVPGMGYTKTILWLQSSGRARDFAPPTRYLKSFINSDIGPYYQYYEDDDYYMKKAMEIAKDFRGTEMIHVYRAIFLYRSFKSAMPRGSKFTPKKLISFMKKRKMSVDKLHEMLSSSDTRDKIMEDACEFACA